jgi:uncharacterized protein YggE
MRVITWVAIGCLGPFATHRAHAQHEGKETATMKTEPRTLSVRGVGKISAKPDSVHIQIGVTSEAPTAIAALAANNESMNRLFDIAKQRGIAEKDIQTSRIQVMPVYSQPLPPRPGEQPKEFIPKIIGYRVDNSVAIRSRDIAKLGPLLDAVVEGGANQVHGISFQIDDTEKLMAEARKKAMADAKEKASLLAGEAGVVVGPPIKIEEDGGGRPIIESFGGPKMMGRMAAAAPMPVAAGEQDLSVTVSVVYEIKVP